MFPTASLEKRRRRSDPLRGPLSLKLPPSPFRAKAARSVREAVDGGKQRFFLHNQGAVPMKHGDCSLGGVCGFGATAP